MGKFIIDIRGTNLKGEIISASFLLTKSDNETIEACKTIFKEDYSHYYPVNITVDVTDLEELFHDFKATDQRRVDMVVYRMKREAIVTRQKELEMLKILKEKYPEKFA